MRLEIQDLFAHKKTLISVSTYKRTSDLKRLVDSVAPQLNCGSCQLLVVDNSPDADAMSFVHSLGPICQYVHEPLPGIAATRNQGLRIAEEGNYDYLIFLDDDEWVSTDWHNQIIAVGNETNEGVVVGPVRTVYTDETPMWIKRYGFHQRVMLAEGAHPRSTATHNTLLKVNQWRLAGSIQFDDDFSFTGGSDSDFFARLSDRGVKIYYTRRAVVFEFVPENRASMSWLTKRGLRVGAVHARIRLRSEPRSKLIAGGILRALKGLLLLPLDITLRKQRVAESYATFLRGVGMFLQGIGIFRFEEYSRK
ncbi:glycosyl transferase family A [Glutamicibacter uratoxydans]|uniref:Glycosyl transferase family A n=1 Tax=Glutamicibacter uratoxydans TaxID=43667 RepID=A0A4Y4DZT5_GLUUR|nr:glycosyltransferase [Glutamicibacter uratoxydans]GED07861.1 glycosyl transferase family A [Glutamicibacter uratoxydans]